MINGILLNDLDNVVTVTGDISTGEAVCYIRGGKTCKIRRWSIYRSSTKFRLRILKKAAM